MAGKKSMPFPPKAAPKGSPKAAPKAPAMPMPFPPRKRGSKGY